MGRYRKNQGRRPYCRTGRGASGWVNPACFQSRNVLDIFFEKMYTEKAPRPPGRRGRGPGEVGGWVCRVVGDPPPPDPLSDYLPIFRREEPEKFFGMFSKKKPTEIHETLGGVQENFKKK